MNKPSKRVPKYLQSMAERYRAKPSGQEIAKVMRRAVAAGWTQAELADLFGAHQQAVSRWLAAEPEKEGASQ